MNLPSSKKEADMIGSKRFLTGTPCPNGHIAPRYARSWACCECCRIAKNEYRRKNLERLREQDREYARLNAEKRREYALRNADRIKEMSKKRSALYPEKKAEMSSLRRSSKRQGAPN